MMSVSACSIGPSPVSAAHCSVKRGLGDITLASAELVNHSSWRTATDITVSLYGPKAAIIPYQFHVLLKPGETKKALAIHQFPVEEPYDVRSQSGGIPDCVTVDVRFSFGADWERGPPL